MQDAFAATRSKKKKSDGGRLLLHDTLSTFKYENFTFFFPLTKCEDLASGFPLRREREKKKMRSGTRSSHTADNHELRRKNSVHAADWLSRPPLPAVFLSRWLLTHGCVLVGHCSNVLAAWDEVAAAAANQTAAFSKFQPMSGRSSLCPSDKAYVVIRIVARAYVRVRACVLVCVLRSDAATTTTTHAKKK